LATLRREIAQAAAGAARTVDSVTLLAVSKGHPVSSIRAAAQLGVRDFAESYLQEALPKLAALRDLTLTWHFIGRIQGNKTRDIAEQFDWVHGIDRWRIAERLAAQRPFHAPPLQACIQVNIGADPAKAGIAPEAAADLAYAMLDLPRVRLRGLMCILPGGGSEAEHRAHFAALRQLLQDINAQRPPHAPPLDTLSMGMSDDFPAAIAEGATLVRIGTALFGARPEV